MKCVCNLGSARTQHVARYHGAKSISFWHCNHIRFSTYVYIRDMGHLALGGASLEQTDVAICDNIVFALGHYLTLSFDGRLVTEFL